MVKVKIFSKKYYQGLMIPQTLDLKILLEKRVKPKQFKKFNFFISKDNFFNEIKVRKKY